MQNRKTLITNQEIAARVRFSGELPRIIIGIGPSRSGTTLFARMFAEAGIDAWYQPLKAILRGYLHNNDVRLEISKTDRLFIKEALGAYTKNEASFDPIEVFMEAGLPASHIALLSLVREPFATATSIVEHFSPFKEREDLVDIFILCYYSIQRIAQRASSLGIKHLPFVYEAWRDNVPLDVAKKVFDYFDITLDTPLSLDWRPITSLQTELEHLHWLPEPPQYYNHTDFFKKVRNTPGAKYYRKSSDEIRRHLSNNELERIEQSGVLDIYDEFRRRCEQQLGIVINKTSVF